MFLTRSNFDGTKLQEFSALRYPTVSMMLYYIISINRLNSGSRDLDNFFVQSKILFWKICKWFSHSCRFREWNNFGLIPWEFDFENFDRILKLRRLHQYAWAVFNINFLNCLSHYSGHFDSLTFYRLLDFDRTYAILTNENLFFEQFFA